MKRIVALTLGAIMAVGGISTSVTLVNAARPHAIGASQAARACDATGGMAYIPAGVVLLGEDGPGRDGRQVQVPAFWIDRHEVTNREFAQFVARTQYVTQAEREGGSAIFVPPSQVAGDNAGQWWRFRAGASWRHPDGPGSTLLGKEDYPVVHVTYDDALAYARSIGRELPDATQWERAARAEQTTGRPPLEWAFSPEGRPIANSWQGVFPVADTGDDGWKGIAPVGCFAGNGFGLHDMIGNVWEWTTTARAGERERLLKGGSYLCASNYCANFRAAAFQAQERDLGASHIGFRTIRAVTAADAGKREPARLQ